MHHRDEQFTELIRENDARLRRICRVYARDPEQERDLYQDILVQVWRSLPSFRGDSAVETWLYRVALNTALGQRRERATRRETSLQAQPQALRARTPAPDQAFESKQRLDRLHGAIDRLGDVEKALVAMYLDGRTYRDMADVLGISANNVGVKLHRIRKRLAAWMKETAA